MATKPLELAGEKKGHWRLHRWTGLAAGDDGAPLVTDGLAAGISVRRPVRTSVARRC